jgi:SAM-dependent methyltransferase
MERRALRYTLSSQRWLERRYKRRVGGVYLAHQPIYGFEHRHLCDPGATERYVCTYRILNLLSSLRFRSLLDVGGGEGYRSALVKEKLGTQRVVVADLSWEACRRARKLFRLPSVVAEIHSLPFKNRSFEVVMCTETLEHVMGTEGAVKELARVAKKAVIVTVNRKNPSLVEKYPKCFPYDVEWFDPHSLDFLKGEEWGILSFKMISPLTRFLGLLLDAQPRRHSRFWRFPKFLTSFYNFLCPFLKRMGRKSLLHLLLLLDPLLSKFTGHRALLFLAVKEGEGIKGKKIPPYSVTEFQVEPEVEDEVL